MKKNFLFTAFLAVLFIIGVTSCFDMTPKPDSHIFVCHVCDTSDTPIKNIEISVDAHFLYENRVETSTLTTDAEGIATFMFPNLYSSMAYVFTLTDKDLETDGGFMTMRDTLDLDFYGGSQYNLTVKFTMDKIPVE